MLKQQLASARSLAEHSSGAFGDGGLSHHIGQLERELESMQAHVSKAARVTLTFRGPKVVGQQGIDASFGSDAVHAFQKLISAFSPNAPARLFITGPARGSFGFVLEELGQQQLLGDSSVSSTVEAVTATFEKLVKRREETAMDDLDSGQVSALKAFLKVLVTSGSYAHVASDSSESRISPDDATWMTELAEQIGVTTTTAVFVGTLSGTLPNGRRFEFVPAEDPRVISGVIDTALDIDVDVKPFWDRHCVAVIEKTVTEYPSGYTRTKFTLKSVSPE